MDREIIKKIIEAGNEAPSGGNSQPWKFKVKNNTIEVIAFPEKDHPVLNFRNRGTYIAHGALIENIEVATYSLGYEPSFEFFPQPHISVRITFKTLTEIKNNDLFSAIYNRHTNRKPYETDRLTEKEKIYLFQEANKFPECELLVIEGEKIRQIAENLAFDMVVFLQNQLLHKMLFHEIIWNEEEQKYRPGLYVKTMEVTPPKTFIFRLLKNWKVAQFFNKIKIPQKIYKEASEKASASALMGAIVVSDHDANFIHAGRLMQSIWLRAAKQDLGFQLITGVLFLWQQVNYGKQEIFSEKEKSIINTAYEKLTEILGVKNKIIALTFRIGKANKPLAVSYKRPPEIEWE